MVLRGPNRWLLRVYVGQSATGKNKYSSKVISGTTAEARKVLTAMLREIDTKTYVEPLKVNLSDYLTDWLKGKIDVTERTRVSYGRLLAYVKEALGGVRVGDLAGTQVQKFLTALSERGLSPRTVEYTHRVFHSALESAVRHGTLLRNPAEYVMLPKKSKRKPSVFSVDQMNFFLEITAESPFGLLWLVLLTTGLRPAEACALMWSDIDFEGKWVSVMRVIEDNGHGKQSLSNNVKADSRRTIGLPKKTVDALREWKKSQAAGILAAGEKYQRLGLVFTNGQGGLIDLHLVRKAWAAALKAANTKLASEKEPLLPVIRLYDCRHSHLTSLLANGADLGWVASRAGHSDIKMTRDHYAHVLPETHREMGDMTEKMLQRTPTKRAARSTELRSTELRSTELRSTETA
jgi:integrase